MRFLKYYFYNALLPIGSLFLIGFAYKWLMCHFEDQLGDAGLICALNWQDGFILICSYAIVKIQSHILGFKTISKRLLITLGLYCFSYAIIAFPYLLVSFFQPFWRNVLAHGFCFLAIIEVLYSPHGLYKRRKRENRST